MIVNMEDSQGVLIDPAGTPFKAGDIKWKEIVAQDDKHHRFYDLVNDRITYEPASIRFGIDDTLRIKIDSDVNLGHIQKWVRP